MAKGRRTRRRAEGGGHHPPAAPPSLGWALVLVLAVALAVRLYYFVLTRGQPVWWDEAEYLLAARHVVHDTPMSGFFAGRPMLLSWVLSAAYAVGADELGARVFLLVLSLAGVYLVYSIGRRLHGKLAGLVAALLLSTLYLHVFFSMRVMTEVPHLTACLFGVDLLLSRRPVRVLFAVPLLVVGALTRFPAALMFPIVVCYGALTARGQLVRSRAFLASLPLAALVAAPYLLWATVTHGDPLLAVKASGYLMPELGFSERLDGLRYYLFQAYGTLGPVLMALLGLGVLRALRFVVWPRRVLVDGDPALSAGLLLFVWMAIPVLYFALFLRPLDDRYILLAWPPALIAIAEAVVWLAGLVARRHPRWHAGVALVAGVAGAASLLPLTHHQVTSKVSSYGSVRDAGLLLAATSGRDAVIMTAAGPQLTYYAQRSTEPIPGDPLAFLRRVADRRADYLVLSSFEEHPRWLTSRTLRALGLRSLGAFPAQRPEVIVLGLPAGLRSPGSPSGPSTLRR